MEYSAHINSNVKLGKIEMVPIGLNITKAIINVCFGLESFTFTIEINKKFGTKLKKETF
jgi:hypothetical protein